MGVFTEKEYKNKKSNSGGADAPSVSVVLEEEKVVRTKEVVEVWFKHPEIPSSGPYPEFEDKIKIDDSLFIRKCIRGIVKTNEKPLVDFLKKKGWEVLHTEKIIIKCKD